MFFDTALKNEISKAKIVSFDIFDTLLIRPYVSPTDLFLHLEKTFSKPQFYAERIEAEKRTRLSHPQLEDITYDMIYEEIDVEFKDMYQKEMDWEEMVLRVNPEIKQIYDYAKEQNKKIVIASDMYLPYDFVAKILRKNGYNGWYRLYISGDVNAIKTTGSLFRRMMAELAVNASDIVHIGDNKKADYKAPRKLGIKAVLYPKICDQYLDASGYYSRAQFKNVVKCSLGLSILFATTAYHWLSLKCKTQYNKGYWHELGYKCAGPIGYGYTRFVDNIAKENGIEALLFVARDGHLLQKIMNIFSPQTPSVYIYATRFLNHICRLDYDRKKTSQAQAILDFFAQKDAQVNKICQERSNPTDVIQQNMPLLQALSQQQMVKYQHYVLNKIPKANSYAVVDMATGAFSPQKLLQAALKKEFLGIYWGIYNTPDTNKYRYKSFTGVYERQGAAPIELFFTKNWPFIEFLITSPEHPIQSVDDQGNPVYAQKVDGREIKRSELYPQIVEGALDFTKDIQAWFGGCDIYLSASDIISWINSYIEHPSKKDMENMQDIYVGEDSSHENWIPLFAIKTGIIDLLKSPLQTFKTLKKAVWRTPMQTLLLCCCKPLSIRTKGIRRMSFILLPYLKRHYFTLQLHIDKSWYYDLTIGKKEA